MRAAMSIAFSVVASAVLCGTAIAAPAAAPVVTRNAAGTVVPFAAADADCQKVGGDVSALIDTGATSPNISRARATFQVGIMECMEGDNAAANYHYQEAKKLLTSDRQDAPGSLQKP